MDDVVRRYGHNLPHWSAAGATYFVTFRLADALPRTAVEEMQREYERLLRVEAQVVRRKLMPGEIENLKRRQRHRLERYLDSGAGACHLKNPACAQIVRDALLFFDGQRYALGAWTVMPNHAHVIVKPFDEQPLEKIVKSWKSFTSRAINQRLDRSGRLWQPEAFDHLIRSHESFCRLTKYVLDNPAEAGLRNWPWSGIGTLRSGEDE